MPQKAFSFARNSSAANRLFCALNAVNMSFDDFWASGLSFSAG